MAQWIPLFVAVVAAATAIGVAFWNSRGESAELRQLKALNEALSAMSGPTKNTEAIERARDELALRVAAWISSGPARRRRGWTITGIAVGFVFASLGVVAITPWLASLGWSQSALNAFATALGSLSALVAIVVQRRVSSAERSKPGGAGLPSAES
ncbi:flagellar basal body-associated protein FliL [Microbacterium foliorum]|uniref:hypothetical protein n=1 Tax=Microbacterium foliorum TaxID=104336 RepID=UPI0020A200B9|nr:hypothetical protein [Microbacterium foliorum]MCP1427531.1 flagellar basal body-associated protein FliL [Microbacterium foliorum]